MQNEKESLFKKWHRKADELRVQMNLGQKELSDNYDETKQNITNWARESREKLAEFESESYQSVRQKLEELELQASLARAEGRDALAEQHEKLQSLIGETRAEMAKIAEKSSDKSKAFMEASKDQIDDWHTKFDLFKLRLNLGAADAKDHWDDQKKRLSSFLTEMDAKIDGARESGEEHWDTFKTDISDSWKKFKSSL